MLKMLPIFDCSLFHSSHDINMLLPLNVNSRNQQTTREKANPDNRKIKRCGRMICFYDLSNFPRSPMKSSFDCHLLMVICWWSRVHCFEVCMHLIAPENDSIFAQTLTNPFLLLLNDAHSYFYTDSKERDQKTKEMESFFIFQKYSGNMYICLFYYYIYLVDSFIIQTVQAYCWLNIVALNYSLFLSFIYSFIGQAFVSFIIQCAHF